MTIYLLRHGTTPWNAIRRLQGRTDVPLDETGEKIAHLTGEALKFEGVSFSRVYSSPLHRALRTAQLVAGDVPILTDARLEELHFGTLEGESIPILSQEEDCPFRYFHSHPDLYDLALRELERTRPGEHFESFTSLCKRTESFIQEVIIPLVQEAGPEERILISGHGAMNRALLMGFMGNCDLRSFWGKGLQPNCGITLIEAKASPSGEVVFSTEDESRIYYDPNLLTIPSLL